MWNDLAVLGGTTVPPGTAVPLVVRPGLCVSRFFVFGVAFHSATFPCFSSCFRVLERGLKSPQTLDSALNSCFWIGNYEDLTIVLPSSFNLFKFVFILSSLGLLFLGFVCVLQWLLI